MKKAAMFGLDARIALAIFGALSVISGAALYSAIQQAKITRYVTDLTEVSKAIEQYMLDTGVDVAKKTPGSYPAELNELITSSVVGWKGPYISRGYDSTQGGLVTDLPFYTTGNSAILADFVDGEAAVGGAVTFTPCSSSSKYCYYWVRYGALKNTGFADSIDEYVDGVVDHDAGNVRIYTHPTHNYQHVWVRGPKTLSEID
jgi:type II secretory pathway pseudopilin PulG